MRSEQRTKDPEVDLGGTRVSAAIGVSGNSNARRRGRALRGMSYGSSNVRKVLSQYRTTQQDPQDSFADAKRKLATKDSSPTSVERREKGRKIAYWGLVGRSLWIWLSGGPRVAPLVGARRGVIILPLMLLACGPSQPSSMMRRMRLSDGRGPFVCLRLCRGGCCSCTQRYVVDGCPLLG